jgi:hypothetical protein
MTDPDLTVLKELFNARFDALEARLETYTATLERENGRQDEAIERLTDRSTHVSETRRILERVEKTENVVEVIKERQSDLSFKMKITWGAGAAAIGALLTMGMAYAKYVLGI